MWGNKEKETKCPDTGVTRTRDSGSGGSSLNHQTTSAPKKERESECVVSKRDKEKIISVR